MSPEKSHYNLPINKKGFTLIELVTTLVILGIISLTFIRPNVIDIMDTMNIQAGTVQVKTDITNTKIESMSERLLKKVIFTPGSTTYSMYTQSTAGNSWELEINSYAFPTGMTVLSTSLTDDQVIFDEKGIPYEDLQSKNPTQITDALSSERNIILETANGMQSTITIIPETGFIQI
ncbi:prepilin-type N-terminal cleavage/methylation domain-containing protein [bacterium]|jgi:prepilin-type N-terminal cleavage/methylation domain-containing protein|nr:prepilin-type N-terminal cleavage/methylation domain-containing protein [bacterium]